MRKHKTPSIQLRKAPRQQRSASMVADILEAAVRVLSTQGAQRFTTVRVAQAAGVSVGSLYQYFPNKQALLFRLQAEEWQRTWAMLSGILEDAAMPPLERLRHAIQAFFRSEHEEAALRVALADAKVQLRDAPESAQLQARAARTAQRFMREALPTATARQRAFAADFVFTSIGALAERVTSEQRTAAEIARWADTCADVLCAHLARLQGPQAGPL